MKYSIDTKEKVILNGLKQKIHIRGTRPENPVILFLHGGPGIANRHSIMARHSDLCESYTIVAWDQRGTGGSYQGCRAETLTVNQLVEDCRSLVDHLCERLGKQKVYLIGGSWGTELGTFVCHRYPEKIGGYIGYGQVVNGVLNEDLSYRYALEKAIAAGDEEAQATLRRVGPPIRGCYSPVFEGLMAQRKILKKYGGHAMKKGSYWSQTVRPILLSGEYSLLDKIGIIKGYKLVLSTMWSDVVRYNFIEDCVHFSMPYYIFQGRYDKTTPSDLIQEFFDAIQAPAKELVWFEHSAHGPLSEEPEKFKALIRERFL